MNDATTSKLHALAVRVANLNRDAGEIGAGMLAQLVDQAREIVPYAAPLSVNGIEFPAPVREPLERGQEYFVAAPTEQGGYVAELWCNDIVDTQWLKLGLIHLTAEAAAAHSRAMLSIAEKGDLP